MYSDPFHHRKFMLVYQMSSVFIYHSLPYPSAFFSLPIYKCFHFFPFHSFFSTSIFSSFSSPPPRLFSFPFEHILLTSQCLSYILLLIYLLGFSHKRNNVVYKCMCLIFSLNIVVFRCIHLPKSDSSLSFFMTQ